FSAWMARLAEAGEVTSSLDDVADEVLFRRAVNTLLDQRRLAAVLGLYRYLDAPEQAVIILDELSRSQLRNTGELAAALDQIKEWVASPQAIFAGWLRAARLHEPA